MYYVSQYKVELSSWNREFIIHCFVIVRWSVRCGHKKRQERPSKTEFIILTGPQNRSHEVSCRATW